MPNVPHNLGMPDEESANLDQEIFDQQMADIDEETQTKMLHRLIAATQAGQEHTTKRGNRCHNG
jgi:hypothetical protein